MGVVGGSWEPWGGPGGSEVFLGGCVEKLCCSWGVLCGLWGAD